MTLKYASSKRIWVLGIVMAATVQLLFLYWEHNGFWLLYRRLERGTFAWPSDRAGTLAISARQLRWLLDGLELSQRRAHPQVVAQTVI